MTQPKAQPTPYDATLRQSVGDFHRLLKAKREGYLRAKAEDAAAISYVEIMADSGDKGAIRVLEELYASSQG